MGRSSRRKGYGGERELVLLARSYGLEARRVPLSGAQEGYPGDVILDGKCFEVKRRGTGFAQLYRWLEGSDGLAVRADGKPWLVVVPAGPYLTMLQILRRSFQAHLKHYGDLKSPTELRAPLPAGQDNGPWADLRKDPTKEGDDEPGGSGTPVE